MQRQHVDSCPPSLLLPPLGMRLGRQLQAPLQRSRQRACQLAPPQRPSWLLAAAAVPTPDTHLDICRRHTHKLMPLRIHPGRLRHGLPVLRDVDRRRQQQQALRGSKQGEAAARRQVGHRIKCTKAALPCAAVHLWCLQVLHPTTPSRGHPRTASTATRRSAARRGVPRRRTCTRCGRCSAACSASQAPSELPTSTCRWLPMVSSSCRTSSSLRGHHILTKTDHLKVGQNSKHRPTATYAGRPAGQACAGRPEHRRRARKQQGSSSRVHGGRPWALAMWSGCTPES